jgi:hypothetical protein
MNQGHPTLKQPVLLQKSKYSNTSAPGMLELKDGRISFTLVPEEAEGFFERFAAGNWRFIEEARGMSGIRERLERGEPVEVFNVAASEAEVKKLSIISSLTGFELKTPDGNFVLVFKQIAPYGSFMFGGKGMKTGAREASNQWQKAIADAAP